ncbi:unnamed protein product [Arabidopsis halleri]
MSQPRWFQVITEENLDGYCKKHSCGFRKNIFRFESCDVVCLEGIDPYHIQPHVQVVPLFDVNGLDMDEISDIFDCFQIQNKGLIGGKGLIALRPWRRCIRTKEGCTKHVRGTSKFCSFTCKVEHVLENEGDLSSIIRNWSEDDSRETSEHIDDLSLHPCGDPEKIFPFKKRSRRRIEFYDSDEFEEAFAYSFRDHLLVVNSVHKIFLQRIIYLSLRSIMRLFISLGYWRKFVWFGRLKPSKESLIETSLRGW